MDDQLHSLRKQMNNLQVARGRESHDYEDLCSHTVVDMLVGYRPHKFSVFNGTSDSHAYLRVYCDTLVGVGRNEKLRMKLFIRGLTGEALTWYTRKDPRRWREWRDVAEDFMNLFRFNTKITPDRFTW